MTVAEQTRPRGVQLRELRWTDLPRVVELDREFFGADGWSQASWWAELAGRPQRDYVVVTDDEGIAGYGGIDVNGELADVMSIAVHPRLRGRGVGAWMLAELEHRARAMGARHLLLEVRADNLPAKGLYASAGYDVLDVRRKYYQPEGVDAVIMRKSFGGAA